MIGTTMALILGATALAGTAAGTSAYNSAQSAKAQSKVDAAASQAKKDAEQRSLMETQMEEKNKTARQSLLDTPTSGFGPNKNLARSFLTTL